MNDFNTILQKISTGEDLSSQQAGNALREIIAGNINTSRIAAFLYGMSCKGETVEELTALVNVMREAAVPVNVNLENAVDLCGTGGDKSGTFNISTSAMFVVAGADVPVLKHGNSGVSSRSGSFDVLKSLGAQPDLPKEQVETCFLDTQMAFMFAPLFHPAMANVMPVRKELGIHTFFNIMGPILNPANVKRQVIGAYEFDVAHKIIQILSNFETEFAYTVHSEDGLDEFSTTSDSSVFCLLGGQIEEMKKFKPDLLGLPIARHEDLKGGDPEDNARITRDILDNRTMDAKRDIVLLNAAFAIHASGLISDIQEAFYEAQESLESGKAKEKLRRFVECTSDLKGSNT